MLITQQDNWPLIKHHAELGLHMDSAAMTNTDNMTYCKTQSYCCNYYCCYHKQDNWPLVKHHAELGLHMDSTAMTNTDNMTYCKTQSYCCYWGARQLVGKSARLVIERLQV